MNLDLMLEKILHIKRGFVRSVDKTESCTAEHQGITLQFSPIVL
jgi:hypothetical protein